MRWQLGSGIRSRVVACSDAASSPLLDLPERFMASGSGLSPLHVMARDLRHGAPSQWRAVSRGSAQPYDSRDNRTRRFDNATQAEIITYTPFEQPGLKYQAQHLFS